MTHAAIYIIAAVVLLMISGFCYQKLARARDRKRFPPPGKMIDVGGHRLHLISKGAGSPTVVVEQGAGAPSIFWWKIQDEIATFSRVCVYDRAGLGWSDPAPGARAVEDQAEELHTLLIAAGVPGPYLLVGHSYGGFIVRSFALSHREQVAGLVLVDVGEEGVYSQPDVVATYSKFKFMARMLGWAAELGIFRIFHPTFLKASVSGLSEATRQAAASVSLNPHSFFAASDDLASALECAASWSKLPPSAKALGGLPITVITHGQPFPPPFNVAEKYWDEGQRRLAKIFTNSTFIVAERSSHMIHDDEPELVVDAIRRIVLTADGRASASRCG